MNAIILSGCKVYRLENGVRCEIASCFNFAAAKAAASLMADFGSFTTEVGDSNKHEINQFLGR
jgi:hypothetical protein